jgi:UDP-N-acetylmuramoyl-L-alanyl-D-glutamate--2,6-diaminopimelate ligase
MVGEYNVSNALASICVAEKLEIEKEVIKKGLAGLRQIPGRTQILQTLPFMVVVDFAHTPNGLENVLRSVRSLCKGNLIAVFGCAGKRDTTKRPLMGEVAAKYADVTILTAEDPRSEELKTINDHIEEGWRKAATKQKSLIRFDDPTQNVKVREDAIRKALDIANEGDLVIVCGKSHEKSLCFGNTEYPWNDIEMVKKLLAN